MQIGPERSAVAAAGSSPQDQQVDKIEAAPAAAVADDVVGRRASVAERRHRPGCERRRTPPVVADLLLAVVARAAAKGRPQTQIEVVGMTSEGCNNSVEGVRNHHRSELRQMV